MAMLLLQLPKLLPELLKLHIKATIHGSLAALATGGSEPLQQLQLAKAATWMAI